MDSSHKVSYKLNKILYKLPMINDNFKDKMEMTWIVLNDKSMSVPMINPSF